ncbi:MAG: DNA-directed RNA polymerase subunit omega [Acholeplasmatales bacterium]|jgi:DNA-directed RNA polymerase omega subunit|nr:DNA-directed RNA polymerase subunit omega [Acholeplasmatales bacterium]
MSKGIDYPSIDELLTKFNSKYKLAYLAGVLAKYIKEEKLEFDSSDYQCKSPIGIALEEILKGNLKSNI